MGGSLSAPISAVVSACEISRIGTRMSGREPSIYTLRELGKGWIAAASTSAAWLRNLGLAFMVQCSKSAGSIILATDASLRRHYPYRFKGCISLRPDRLGEDPHANIANYWKGEAK